MFDDSKRLDTLEAQMAALTKAYSATVAVIDSNMANLNKNTEALIKWQESVVKALTQTETNFKDLVKRIDALDKQAADLDGQMKKLTQRVGNLEAVVSKLKK